MQVKSAVKTAPPPRGATELIDVPTTAGRLGVSPRYVWQLLSSGRLRAIRLSRRVTRIDATDVERLIDAARGA